MLLAAVIIAAIAVGLLAYALLMPWPVRVPLERRRPGYTPEPSLAHRSVVRLTNLVERGVESRTGAAGTQLLDLAAVSMHPQRVTLWVIVGALAAGVLGLVAGGPVLGILLLLAVPVGIRVVVGIRIRKRQQRFADQIEDSLQLMASSLRAGHSLQQALASLAQEAGSPTAEEFTRVVNETRVGRDLGEALEVTAHRMDSVDFAWVIQAIEINREVGGNLAEVFDGVADTIRQRNEVRRQVATLSAEGRLSGIILMLLPFGVGGFLLLTNPAYLAPFTTSVLGYGLLGLSAVLLLVGGLWLRKTVEVKF